MGHFWDIIQEHSHVAREVVGSFVKLFNDEWLVEKNGFLSPHQAREAWHKGDLLEKAA